MKNNFLIITNYNLHLREGAAYSRMNCYQKSLGADYKVYSLEINQFTKKINSESFRQTKNSDIYFFDKNIKKSFIQRNLFKYADYRGLRNMFSFINSYFSSNDSSILLYTSNFFLFYSVIIKLKYLKGYKVIIEKNELELGIILNSTSPPLPFSIFYYLLFPFQLLAAWLMDMGTYLGTAVIVISENLKRKYKSHPKVLKIPILTDNSLFLKKATKKDNVLRFIYVGMITKKKDALFELIDSFMSNKDILKNKVELHIFGSGNKHLIIQLKKIISTNNLEGMIYFNGSVKHDLVPEILKEYDIAVLLRKSNLQTKYGFSTKLAEYLAAGLPVMTTKVSDNVLYLKDNVNSILVDEVTKDEINRVISHIVAHPDETIGLSYGAQQTAVKMFDYRNYSTELKNLIQ